MTLDDLRTLAVSRSLFPPTTLRRALDALGFVQADPIRAQALLAFIRERGTVHPREVDTRFSPGAATNYWGGSSSATTHLTLWRDRVVGWGTVAVAEVERLRAFLREGTASQT